MGMFPIFSILYYLLLDPLLYFLLPLACFVPSCLTWGPLCWHTFPTASVNSSTERVSMSLLLWNLPWLPWPGQISPYLNPIFMALITIITLMLSVWPLDLNLSNKFAWAVKGLVCPASACCRCWLNIYRICNSLNEDRYSLQYWPAKNWLRWP